MAKPPPQPVEDAASPPVRPSLRSVRAVVNPLSGGVETGAADALRAILAERDLEAEVVEVEGHDVVDALNAAVAAKPDLVILLAGDGTARLAAELCGPEGPLLAPLPGGTMNMLPRALYGTLPWREALIHALDEGVERPVSGGEVDGRRFFVAAILGAPALWATAREALREGKMRLAFLRGQRALRRAFSGQLRFVLDGGDRQKAEALTLMCPLVSRALTRTDALEALVLDPKDAVEGFRLGARTLLTDLLGDWRNDPAVTAQTCCTGRAWARGRIPAILDGEPCRLHPESKIAFVPKAFRALALATEQAQPSADQSARAIGSDTAVAAHLSEDGA